MRLQTFWFIDVCNITVKRWVVQGMCEIKCLKVQPRYQSAHLKGQSLNMFIESPHVNIFISSHSYFCFDTESQQVKGGWDPRWGLGWVRQRLSWENCSIKKPFFVQRAWSAGILTSWGFRYRFSYWHIFSALEKSIACWIWWAGLRWKMNVTGDLFSKALAEMQVRYWSQPLRQVSDILFARVNNCYNFGSKEASENVCMLCFQLLMMLPINEINFTHDGYLQMTREWYKCNLESLIFKV